MSNLEHSLLQLEAAGLIGLACSLPDVEYLFRHALVQDAAYESLVRTDRRALHRAAGEALERLYPERLAEFAAQLGWHFEEAGEDERAQKYLTVAGDNAYAAFANVEAVEHYSRALAIARRQAAAPSSAILRHLYLRCGRALELTNRYPSAVDLYVEMQAFAQAHGDRALELAGVMAQATVHAVGGQVLDPALAGHLVERAQALARDVGDVEAEAKIAWLQTLLASHTGRSYQALAFGERAIALARRLASPELLGYVLNDMSRVYLGLGQTDRAETVLKEAEALWRRLNSPMRHDSLGMLIVLSVARGEFEAAFSRLAEIEEASRIGRDLWREALGKQIGAVWVECGEVEHGIALLHEGVTLCEAGKLSYGMFIMPVHLALAYETVGAVERGLFYARRAATNGQAALPVTVPWAKTVVARLCLANGLVSEAQSIVDSAEFQSIPASNWNMAHYAWDAECLLGLAMGQPSRTLTVAEHALEEYRPRGLRLLMLNALSLKGRALAAAGRTPEARETFQEARALAEAIGSRRALWPILAALARTADAEGNHAEAYQLRRQARAVVEYIADHIQTPELLFSFLNLPNAKEVMGQGDT